MNKMIQDENKAIELLNSMKNKNYWVLDLETTGLRPWGDTIIGVSLNGFYFVTMDEQENKVMDGFLKELLNCLNNKNLTVIGHNIKFDINFLRFSRRRFGGDPWDKIKCKIWDTMIGLHIINENLPEYKLKVIGEQINKGMADESKELDQELRSRKLKKSEMWKLSIDLVAKYAIKDVEITKMLYFKEAEFYKKHPKLKEVAFREMEFIKILSDLEVKGLKIDTETLNHLMDYTNENINKIVKEIRNTINQPDLNPNSPIQLQKLFGLKSVSEKVLLSKKDIKGIEEILKYRAWKKVMTSYYEVFVNNKDSDDCLHTNLIPMAATGRLRCSKPNLQALPKTDKLHRVREVFIPHDKDYVFIFADYSQAEMRLATHYAKEENMAKVINSGGDIHTETARELFSIPKSQEVPKKQRTIAKRINFGILYGMGPKALAETLEISIEEAIEHLNLYRFKFPGFAKLNHEVENKIASCGEIKMFTGRKRRLKIDESYKGLNSLIQGGISEMIKICSIKLDQVFEQKGFNAFQIMQVHDEIVFECRKYELKEVVEVIKQVMEDWNFYVPIKVDIEISERWK